VKRQELIDDSTNKQDLNYVIKQHLTDLVIEYNTEVSGQRVPWRRTTGAAACAWVNMFFL
jgi:hypothetical protein